MTPLVGTFMDFAFVKAKNKTNKFRPWILRSIPILGIGLVSLFTMPSLFDGLLCIVVLFVAKIVFELGYTIMNISMGSLLGVMATNDAERASLASARGFGSTVGGMVGGLALPVIISALGETSVGYGIAAAIAAILGCLMVFAHYALTVERNAAAQVAVKTEEEKEAEKIKITDILQVFKVNRPYLALCVHSICICFVQGIAHMTICPMIRDFYDETGVPILYLDAMMHMQKCKDLFTSFLAFHDITVGAYKIMNRIDDVPLVTGYGAYVPQSCAPFNDLFSLGYQSAAVGYCFGENADHMPTPDIPDLQTRDKMADAGAKLICDMVER